MPSPWTGRGETFSADGLQDVVVRRFLLQAARVSARCRQLQQKLLSRLLIDTVTNLHVWWSLSLGETGTRFSGVWWIAPVPRRWLISLRFGTKLPWFPAAVHSPGYHESYWQLQQGLSHHGNLAVRSQTRELSRGSAFRVS